MPFSLNYLINIRYGLSFTKVITSNVIPSILRHIQSFPWSKTVATMKFFCHDSIYFTNDLALHWSWYAKFFERFQIVSYILIISSSVKEYNIVKYMWHNERETLWVRPKNLQGTGISSRARQRDWCLWDRPSTWLFIATIQPWNLSQSSPRASTDSQLLEYTFLVQQQN